MKKFKKTCFIAITVMLIISSFTLSAFAGSETYTGSFEGYSYVVSATCNTTYCRSQFTSQCPKRKRITNKIVYNGTDGVQHIFNGNITGTGTVIGQLPDHVQSFSSMNASFYFLTNNIQNIFVSV